ncbi:MAG: thioredoxin family protein [Tannerellaceae bacterium]|nr:thioredoxin family protein [Tannerellaceae bacterium]
METFEKLINGEKCVLVNFHTNWCDPCKMMDPIMDQIDREQPNAHVVKIDVDEHRILSQQFGIKSFPTFILFKNGEAVWRRSGVVDKATLVREITRRVG